MQQTIGMPLSLVVSMAPLIAALLASPGVFAEDTGRAENPAVDATVPAEQVGIRWSKTPEKARIVFDWPSPVGFETHSTQHAISLDFARPARLNGLEELGDGFAEWAEIAVKEDRGFMVRTRYPTRFETFALDRRVVLDLFFLDQSSAEEAASMATAPEQERETEQFPPPAEREIQGPLTPPRTGMETVALR